MRAGAVDPVDHVLSNCNRHRCDVSPCIHIARCFGRFSGSSPAGLGLGACPGGFIEHYLMPVIYPEGLDRVIQIALGTAVVLVNGVLYARLIHRMRQAVEV